MKKQLLITSEIFDANQDSTEVMGLFASGQLEVGQETEVDDEDQEEGEPGGGDNGCPPATEDYYYEKINGECVKIPY